MLNDESIGHALQSLCSKLRGGDIAGAKGTLEALGFERLLKPIEDPSRRRQFIDTDESFGVDRVHETADQLRVCRLALEKRDIDAARTSADPGLAAMAREAGAEGGVMRTRELKRLKAIAHHEAGHAVVGWVLNPQVRPDHVTIVREDGNLGHVEHSRSRARRLGMGDLTPRGQLLRDSEAISLFAGRLAQAKFLGYLPRWGHEGDYHQIACLCYYEEPEMQRLWSRLRYLEAQSRVSRWWPEIEAVAGALEEKKTLTLREFSLVFANVFCPDKKTATK